MVLNRVKATFTVPILIAFCLLLSISSLVFSPSSLQAVVCVGECVCSNCHTMHNSQNGQPMNFDSSDIPNALLLRGSCISCHGQNPGGSSNIISFGNVPQVLHSAITDLAGGNFKYLTTSDMFGHNVKELNNPDGSMTGTTPPGDEFNQTGITWGAGATFTCAGKYGCHGDRTISGSLDAIKGAHHYNDKDLKFSGPINEGNQAKTSGTIGEQVGSSYRFLKGVKGGEDTDWQATNSVTDHNEYKGATVGVEGGDAYTPGGNTISGFCAECHGNFHGGSADIGGPTGTPWLRHPTDISLPSSGEYIAYTTYSLTAPVARTTIPSSPSATVTPSNTTDDIIMCLSCHRAHASPYFKMMRWDYKGWPANGQTNGCNVCHTSKN